MPSFSRRPRACGSPTSTRRGMFLPRLSTIRGTTFAARSTRGRLDTPRRSFFRFAPDPGDARPRVTVFGEYHAADVVSEKNARAIKMLADELPCRGRLDYGPA